MPGNLTVSINTEAMLDAKSPYISASRGLFLKGRDIIWDASAGLVIPIFHLYWFSLVV